MIYRKMYLILFDAISKAIELLTKAHQEAEKLYIEQEDAQIIPFPKDGEE